jgi:hypothetical protein
LPFQSRAGLKVDVTEAPKAVVGNQRSPFHRLRMKLIRSAAIGLLANALAKRNSGR